MIVFIPSSSNHDSQSKVVFFISFSETQPHHEVADWSSKHDKPLDTSSSPIRVPDEVPQPLPIHDDDDDTMSQQSESESSSPTTSSMKDYCSETRSRSRAITRSRTRSSSQESDITVLSDGSDVMMRSGGFDDVKHEKGPTSMSSFGEDFVILDEDIDMEEDLDDDAFYHDEDELSETESESEAEEGETSLFLLRLAALLRIPPVVDLLLYIKGQSF